MKCKTVITRMVLIMVLCTGCKFDDYGTPQEIQEVEKLEGEMSTLEESIKQIERSSKQLMSELLDAKEEGNLPEQQRIFEELQAQKVHWEQQTKFWKERAAMVNNIVQGSQERATGGVGTFISPFLPAPVRPFFPWMVSIGALIAFPRSRENLGHTFGNLFKGQVWDAIMDLGRTLGLAHTSDDPIAVAKASVHLLTKSGDIEEAEILGDALRKVRTQKAENALRKAQKLENLSQVS